MKKILALVIAALMLCSFAFVMTSCKKDDENDQNQNQNQNDQNNNQNNSAPHTHILSDWATATEATCTAKGTETRYCKVNDCSYSESREVAALGHNLKHHDAELPGCADAGCHAYDTCTRCDYTTYVEIPASGHDYTVNAELNPNGNVCVTCGQTHICVDDNFKNWTTVEVADCTAAGKEVCKCSVCNYVKENTLEKTEHSYGEDGKCTSCGADETDVPELPDHPF